MGEINLDEQDCEVIRKLGADAFMFIRELRENPFHSADLRRLWDEGFANADKNWRKRFAAQGKPLEN